MRCQTLVVAIVVAAAGLGMAAVQGNLDLPTVNEALLFVRTATTAEQSQFNRPYRTLVNKAPVDYIEVITPFRRVVLEGTARRQQTGLLSQKDALALLDTAGNTIDISVELTFNPLNNFLGVPDYNVALVGSDRRHVAASETFRAPRWTVRLEGLPSAIPPTTAVRPGGARMIGATIVGRFPLTALNPAGTYVGETGVTGELPVSASIALAGLR
jgi:hypothetical protein